MAQASLRENGIEIATPIPAFRWVSSSSEWVLAALKSQRTGLCQTEARARLRQFGPNSLPPAARRRWYFH